MCKAYQYQCENGTKCFGGNVPCGSDQCISTTGAYGTHQYLKKNCTIDGIQTCIKKSTTCNGECGDQSSKLR